MIVIFSSIKGGTGKSTLAFHIAVQAFLDKTDICTIDLDFPQFSFSTYYNNRKNYNLPVWKDHIFASSIEEIKKIEEDINIKNDKLIIIDTPGRYEPSLLEMHKKADIIITPINDSFIDINTIMKIEKEKWSTFGNYYEFIYDSKNYNEKLKWLVIRNRSSPISSNHTKEIQKKLAELSKKIDFKLLDGPKDRSIYRELFNKGATVLDLKSKLSISNIAAKFEIKSIWKEIKNS
ncbi:division plane positioning ATPase MipZ [Alphaproteobacteria bacterium endosymbiont of Tiliacea citrago]|uniref:division plane positioning ATPase MipZ n=1 Tax=Alphaproteobacteria bacterium endosymbiont of Tiliacea citrago TaxID=3077944 RepID=UPI00313DD4A4